MSLNFVHIPNPTFYTPLNHSPKQAHSKQIPQAKKSRKSTSQSKQDAENNIPLNNLLKKTIPKPKNPKPKLKSCIVRPQVLVAIVYKPQANSGEHITNDPESIMAKIFLNLSKFVFIARPPPSTGMATPSKFDRCSVIQGCKETSLI